MTINTETPRGGAALASRTPRAPSRSRGSLVFGYLLVAPVIVVMLVVIGYPLVDAVTTSFRDERIIGSPSQFAGFDSYVNVLTDPSFWAALRRSALWLVLNLVVQTCLGLGGALLLQRTTRWSRAARVWVVLPWAIPSIAVTVTWQWLLNTNYGIVYKILDAFGIDLGGALGSSSTALFMIILINSWHWFPLAAVVIYGALSTVPADLIEAARVDGATPAKILFSVQLPIVQPILFALGLVGSLWSINVLDTIYLITQGGPVEATTTIPVYIYNTAFTAFRASNAAAASVITVIILAVASIIVARSAMPKEG